MRFYSCTQAPCAILFSTRPNDPGRILITGGNMRLTIQHLILVAACIVGLSACGGAGQDGGNTEQTKHLASSQKTAPVSSYNQVVQQLYVAYFGRPSDPNGLANFSTQLAADGAPADIQSLLHAYGTNSGVKALIDSFGTSTESQNLYGTADPTSFVKAIFQNVLGRAPATDGLNFWVTALNNGSVTYGNVALQIMAGALINTSAQGQLDAELIGNRITVATIFTSTLTTRNATADYSGSAAAQTARSMLSGITASTSSSTFQSTVDTTVAALIANPPPVNNAVAISVEPGVNPGVQTVDVPFVTLTVCAPNNPSLCQTIDHVLVDTGSYGLRLIYSTLTPQMAAALSAQSSGSTLAECTNFVDGYSWGPVRQINLSIAGESATNLTMQVIGDPAFESAAPCNGTPEDTVNDFGSNGVIGVGLFPQDCGSNCTLSSDNGSYFMCSSNSGPMCNGSTASISQQVQNPVALFASDNNGVIVKLPAVSLNPPSTVSGTLVFGVNTQSDNSLGSASVFQMDDTGEFTTVFSNTSMSQSFIDSGSNGLYFPNQTGIPTCSDSFYCPKSTLSLSALMQGTSNRVTGIANSQTIAFSIGNANNVTGSVSADFGAPGATGSFDWGLPFFFGRNVYVVQDTKSAAGQQGPFVAF